MISYSEDQARAFVTDAGTLQRGQQLAQPTKWGNLGRNDSTAWGECAGSGSKPYLTGIDLSEPAFKCSCPSRVFPCKHGAGLLLLMARQPALFAAATPPAWLEEWLAKRQQTQGKKADKVAIAVAKATEATPDSEAATDPSATSDSAPGAPASAGSEVSAVRLARMVQGADDLELWLIDLMRNGLATLDQQPANFWEAQAARLVDNQLPGLATTVRELATLRHAHADWPTRLLARLGELYWLVRAFQNRDQLALATRQELLQQVGVTIKQEELAGYAAPVTDEWRVLGQFTWEENRLTARRSWLRGEATGRDALVLEFAFGSQGFATPLVPQGRYTGAMLFYPGPLPLRAAPVSLAYNGDTPPTFVPGQRISQLLDSYADALARQPWLREWPATLADVVLVPQPDGCWLLCHSTEAATLPLRFATEDAPWQLLAESGGQPVGLFGEWDGQAFRVLATTSANLSVEDEKPTDSAASETVATGNKQPTIENRNPDQPLASPSLEEKGLGSEALLRIVLLGTRQSGEPIPPFPIPADTPEQQLLLAAGTLALMQKAGFQPSSAPAPPPAPAASDTRPPLGPAGADCLRQLLEQSDSQNLLPDYLVRVGEVGRRVPAALLVLLLHLATRTTAVAAKLGPALGQRGRWLAALNPQWNALLQKHIAPETMADDLGPWETGTLPERLAWLERRFGQDAAAARALLLSALPTEPAKVQEPLLELLADHLHPDTEPALENLLRARGQEVRRRATELLVQLPGAALTERLWARTAPLLSVRRKLLGLGAATLEVALPTTWDKTWLLDGIEEKNARFLSSHGPNFTTPVGPATARLANLLALLPPGRWTAHLGLQPAELLAAALASEWAQPLLTAWAQSTLLHHDISFATAFLALWQQATDLHHRASQHQTQFRDIDWSALARLVPPAAVQAVLLSPTIARMHRQQANWLLGLHLVPAPWPRALTAAVLHTAAEKLAHTAAYEQHNSEASSIAWTLPHTVAPHLAPADMPWAIEQVEAIPQVNSVFQFALNQFTDLLRFQVSLEDSLRE